MMAALRNLAISLMRNAGETNIAAACCAHSPPNPGQRSRSSAYPRELNDPASLRNLKYMAVVLSPRCFLGLFASFGAKLSHSSFRLFSVKAESKSKQVAPHNEALGIFPDRNLLM